MRRGCACRAHALRAPVYCRVPQMHRSDQAYVNRMIHAAAAAELAAAKQGPGAGGAAEAKCVMFADAAEAEGAPCLRV